MSHITPTSAKYGENRKQDTQYEDSSSENTWKETMRCVITLIHLDLLWTFPMVVLSLLIVALKKSAPSYFFCMLLKDQLEEKKQIDLPAISIAVEAMLSTTFYFMPLALCVLLTEKMDSSLKKNLANFVKNWRKPLKVTVLFCLVDTTYRIIMFVVFHSSFIGEKREYPFWVTYVNNIMWIVGVLVITKMNCRIWTAKHFAHLVITHRLAQHSIERQSQKVQKALQRKVFLSLVLPGISSTVFQILILSTFQLNKEINRTSIIVIIMVISYPIWIFMDKEARNPLPWCDLVRTTMKYSIKYKNEKSENGSRIVSWRKAQTNQEIGEWKDPVEDNGYLFSVVIFVGMTMTARSFQANMATLASKIATGVLASSIGSVFVILEPFINEKLENTSENMKKRLTSKFSVRINPLSDASNSMSDATKKFQKRTVFRWHRSHMVVILNRLEMYSILYGNSVVLLSSFMMKRVYEATGSEEEFSGAWSTLNVVETLIGVALMCLLELCVEMICYAYMLRVEKLPLLEITRKSGFSFSLSFLTTMVLLYIIDQLLVVTYIVLSSGDVNAHIFDYYCTS